MSVALELCNQAFSQLQACGAADTNEVAVGVCVCCYTVRGQLCMEEAPVVRLHHQHHSATNIWQILLR